MNPLVLAALLALSEAPVDAPLPPGAEALSEPGRYRVRKTFDEVLDFYDRLFNTGGLVRWRNVANFPGIKAKHLECLRKKTKWEGINVYETKGEVRLFVVPRDAKKPQKK